MSQASNMWLKRAISIIAIALSLFQLYTAAFGVFTAMIQRSVHLTLVLVLVFLLYPTGKKNGQPSLWFWDYLMAGLSAAAGIYLWATFADLPYRIGIPATTDIFFGIITIVVVLEGTRRLAGWAMPVIALVFLAYPFLGQYLPGVLGHRGYSLGRVMSQVYLTTDGIFGSPLGVAATFVVLFILFGAFLQATGGGKIFIDFAFALAGRSRGGPAKVAVVSSGLMGMISGSPVANVATTGTFTIPLMKKLGYQPHVAGAIEAVASTGGSIMPPVMGAGAFVMSEMTGIPYAEIVVAAIIPAILYYMAAYFFVDFEAARVGMKGMASEELPDLKRTLVKGGYVFIAILILLYILVVLKASPMKAAFWSMVILIGMNLVWVIADERINWRSFFGALENGAKGTLLVSTACATAGIIIAVIAQTGIGLALSSLLVDLGQNSLLLTLILTMVISIIMGMGLPPTAAYIILGVLTAPALAKLGLPALVAHMFVFYFTCFAPITPPVALAAYTGAGIAGSDPMRTGWTAWRIGLVAFIIPYMMVYGQALLAMGTWYEILQVAVTSSIGVFSLATAVSGWFWKSLAWWQRGLGLVAAILLIETGSVTDLIGVALLAALLVSARLGR